VKNEIVPKIKIIIIIIIIKIKKRGRKKKRKIYRTNLRLSSVNRIKYPWKQVASTVEALPRYAARAYGPHFSFEWCGPKAGFPVVFQQDKQQYHLFTTRNSCNFNRS